MKIWFKIMKDSKLLAQETIVDDGYDTRTHKIMNAIAEACQRFDLEQPYWLKKNEQEFLASAKTRFTPNNFIEEVDFDYLEILVLEEDFVI